MSTKKKPCAKPVTKNTCAVGVSGVLGGLTDGVPGGAALGAKNATGSLVITCLGYSTGVTITAPSHTFNVAGATVDAQAHTFSQSIVPRCAAACTSCTVISPTTLTCKLSEAEEKIGLKAVGNWQATINWHYAATDEAATNPGVVQVDGTYGSCKILIVAKATLNSQVNATRSGVAACGFGGSDTLQ